ncbi:MAG: cytochrome P450 [Haloarculaceae archaeon]
MSSANPQGLQTIPDALQDREAWLEPFDWYAEMREQSPVRYDPARDTWDVFRYEDVKSVLADDETFSANPRELSDFQEPEGPGQGLIFETMLFQDPPRHDALRGVVDDAFDPRAVRDLEPRIRELTTELLDDALADGATELDVVADLAYPLPVIVIAELLGVPAERREQFKEWSDTLVSAASAREDTAEYLERQQEIQMEMATYFMDLIEARREDPRDDLVSEIVTAELPDGSQLSQQEALGTCMLLLIAGNVTTTNLVTNAVRCFADEGALDAVRGDERALRSAIEEVLRYRSPVQAMTRAARTETTIGGEKIAAGDRIAVWLGSANRDEGQFPDADQFVPDRSPNQHLGFGHGTHYCLGAPLARLEANVALGELLDRIAAVEIAADELQPLRSSFIYGVESLPIRFERVD